MEQTIQTAMHFASSDTGVKKNGIYYVPFSMLQLALDENGQKFNCRKDLGSKEELEELMNSLINQGPRVPLRGKKVPGEELYDVYQGERRFTAAKMAFEQQGLDIIFPVLVYPPQATRKDILLDTILTNGGKELNPVEMASTVNKLIVEEMTQEDIAKSLGVSIVYVKSLEMLHNAPAKIKKLVADGKVSATLIIQEMKKKGFNPEEFVQSVLEAEKDSNKTGKGTAKVTAKDLKKARGKGKGSDSDEEGELEQKETRAATSLGNFKKFRKQNSGIYKDQQAQATFELVCDLIDNKLTYNQILTYFTGK